MNINKAFIFKIVKSLTTIIAVSSLVSVFFFMGGASFVSVFCIATALQFIMGYLVSAYLTSKHNTEVYLNYLSKLEKLSTILDCAFCNTPNIVTFLPQESADFECTNCKNTNAVKIAFSVSRATTPSPSLTAIKDILSEPQKNHNIKL